jgi:hypothetical protein
LFNPDDPLTAPQVPATERAAPQIGVEVRFFEVRSQGDLIAAFKALTDWHADGVLWLAGLPTDRRFRTRAATPDYDARAAGS